MRKTILITGANGFVGSSIAYRFRLAGWRVIGVLRSNSQFDVDFETQAIAFDVSSVTELVRDHLPDVIFHAAGSASVPASMENPYADFMSSVYLFETLLESIRLSGKKPLVIFPSSAAVYGNPMKSPIPESSRLSPISPYGYHKLICERIAAEYFQLFGIPSLALRIFSLIGAGQKKLLIWELFNKFLGQDIVELIGTGQEARDYLSINILSEMIFKVVQLNIKEHLVLNVGSGMSYTVKEIAGMFLDYFGAQKKILYASSSRKGDPLSWCADIGNYHRTCGYYPRMDLRDELYACIDSWIQELHHGSEKYEIAHCG